MKIATLGSETTLIDTLRHLAALANSFQREWRYIPHRRGDDFVSIESHLTVLDEPTDFQRSTLLKIESIGYLTGGHGLMDDEHTGFTVSLRSSIGNHDICDESWHYACAGTPVPPNW